MVSEVQLVSMMDRLAIRERVDGYIDALNHRDWERYADFLTEDVVWTCSAPVDQRIESRKAMLAMVSSVQQYQYGFVFQMGHGLVIETLDGSHAKARHTLHIVSDRSVMIGLYYDRLTKEADGEWRFARRDFQITYHDTTPLPGKVHRMLPDPAYKSLPGP